MSKAATVAVQTCEKDPTSAAATAGTTRNDIDSKVGLRVGAMSNIARVDSTPVDAHTMTANRPVLMPSNWAVTGRSDMARSCSPTCVFAHYIGHAIGARDHSGAAGCYVDCRCQSFFFITPTDSRKLGLWNR